VETVDAGCRQRDGGMRLARRSRRPVLPYTSVIVRDVALLCFPHDDAVFSAFVRRTFVDLAGDTPTDLQHVVRSMYPHAVARSREQLASLAGTAWYIYRDGRYSPFADGRPWWEEPTAAHIVIDDAGCYLDANPAALELLGVSLDELRRSKAGDFAPPNMGAEAPWILQLLRDTGELHSTSILRPRGNGSDMAVEFRFAKDGAGPGRHLSTLRRVTPEIDGS
jgi:PAS domain S-box-containing protein